MDQNIRSKQLDNLCRAWGNLSKRKRIYIFYLIYTDRLRSRTIPAMLWGVATFLLLYTLMGHGMAESMIAVTLACLVSSSKQ